MPIYEYKVIPAPRRGEKARGAKTTADRFAVALTDVMNALGRDGWEYLRADTLPCEERVGLTGKTTAFQNMLVFRRALESPVRVEPAAPPAAPPAPRIVAPVAKETAPVPRIGTPAPEPAPAPPLGPARPDAIASG